MITKGRINWDDGTPVVGYKVEVWDSDVGPDVCVGDTTTDGSGNYSLDHKKRQDPKWLGKKRRKGDFYIKVRKPKNGTFQTVHRSKVYQDYAPSTLTINVVLNRIIVNYGVNTVFGKVLAKCPDGHTEPLGRAKVIVKDEDVQFDDTLDSVVVGDDGRFIATFSKSDYDPWFEIGEGLPDILVEVKKKHRGKWRRIWRTKTFGESRLPLEVNIEVPAILIRGKVKSYKTCENGQLVDKPVTDLVAKAYDFNSVQSKHYLGESLVQDPPDTVGIFRIWIFGSRDWPHNMNDGSDIFVQLVDKNIDREAWRSKIHWDVVNPTIIDINKGNPLEVTVECEEPEEPEELPPQGTGGTIVYIVNRSGETRYIYQDDVHIDTLYPNKVTIVNIACGQFTKLQAKESISDVYNPVTWEPNGHRRGFVLGYCYEEPEEELHEIWY